MRALLRRLFGDGAEEDRRRAVAYAIREEMDAHPAEREDFPRDPQPAAARVGRQAVAQARAQELQR